MTRNRKLARSLERLEGVAVVAAAVFELLLIPLHSHAQSGQGEAELARRQRESSATIAATLRSPAVDALARQQRREFAAIVDNTRSPAAGPNLEPQASAASASRASLAINQFGSELRYGKPNVVSSDGEHVVKLIRALAATKSVARAQLLAELTDLSNRSVPEAQNFIGFAAEHGAFGASPDMRRALALYAAAAAQGYQAAVYNMAMASAYGRGMPVDFALALQRLQHAAGLAPDGSQRVCGMGSFLSYRSGLQDLGLEFAKDCRSVLAVFAVESANRTPLTPPRLDSLRHTVASGTADGYQLLHQAAMRQPPDDRQYMACKYTLVNRFRATTPRSGDLVGAAAQCVDAAVASSGRAADALSRSQAIAGVNGFVLAELVSLNGIRTSNHFHYSASVPYLPFPQADADLFASVFANAAALPPSASIARN